MAELTISTSDIAAALRALTSAAGTRALFIYLTTIRVFRAAIGTASSPSQRILFVTPKVCVRA